jgi:type II secretory pathway pseudopilin PulG
MANRQETALEYLTRLYGADGRCRTAADRHTLRGCIGTTLVEVMIACLILAILALGGGAYCYLGQSQVALARVKRAALESARSRLEDVRSVALTNYTGVVVWPSSQNETLTIMGKPVTRTTALRYLMIGGGTGTAGSHDFLGIRVTIAYGAAFGKPNEQITLDTFVGQPFH